MFGPYDVHSMFYDRKRSALPLQGESPQRRVESLPLTLEWEHYNDLLREAEFERLARRLPQRPSLASQAWSRAQDWLGELTCRVRSSAFRQPCPEPAA